MQYENIISTGREWNACKSQGKDIIIAASLRITFLIKNAWQELTSSNTKERTWNVPTVVESQGTNILIPFLFSFREYFIPLHIWKWGIFQITLRSYLSFMAHTDLCDVIRWNNDNFSSYLRCNAEKRSNYRKYSPSYIKVFSNIFKTPSL